MLSLLVSFALITFLKDRPHPIINVEKAAVFGETLKHFHVF